MKIGIDMDNTICCTDESIKNYELMYLKEKKLSHDELWSIRDNKVQFLNLYLKDIYLNADLKLNVVESLKKLKELGNELYIITARTEKYVDDIYNIIFTYLKKNNINVDKVFIKAKDKVDVCISENIDIMIDDSEYNYNLLVRNNIKAILFDDKRDKLEVVDRIDGWGDLFRYIDDKKNAK